MNIKEIAKQTGYSVSTVSKAINGYSDISQKTRDNILNFINNKNFTPSRVARDLRAKRLNRIGLLFITKESLEDYIGEFYFSIIRNITTACSEQNYDLLFYTYHKDQSHNLKQICESKNIDGLIICGGGSVDKAITEYSDAPIPIVILNRPSLSDHYISISTNDIYNSEIITDHLIQNGSKQIAFLGSSDDMTINKIRLNGYTNIIKKKLKQDPIIEISTSNIECIRSKINKLLKNNPSIDSILCFNDDYALKTLKILKEKNISVPKRITLAGFDNIYSCINVNPSLTTIQHSSKEISKAAVSSLINEIEKIDNKIESKLFKGQLIPRKSSIMN